MVIFQDIQEVEEWLSPMSYLELWQAVAPYPVFTDEDRAHCDGLISSGKVHEHLILKVLKGMARNALRDGLGLDHRRHHIPAHDAIKSLH